MREQTPIYATLLYDVIKKLNISISEYFYLDMIHKLSYDRWCIKSLDNCASDMNISKRGLIKMRDRLIERGFIKKNIKGHLKVTQLYTDIAVNKVHHSTNSAVNKVPESVNKVHSAGELSATKNNNRIKEELGTGYKKAMQMREQLRGKLSFS